MLLEDFVSISNLTAVFTLNEPTDRKALARMLARFFILLLGADAITPTIIDQVWGQDDTARSKLGGSRGNLALICRHLTSLACVANNTYHLWLTTTFNNGTIIPHNTLQYLPSGVSDILRIIMNNDAAIYVRKPPHSGQERINILRQNLCQHPTNPIHPTLMILSSAGIVNLSLTAIAPLIPLELTTIFSQHLGSTLLHIFVMHENTCTPSLHHPLYSCVPDECVNIKMAFYKLTYASLKNTEELSYVSPMNPAVGKSSGT
jgi:hypothetical protein